ncbi:hypothetical protein K469DRAFT_685099 [Zopfia rhizophila CBS 207.26]|uniref:Uncharacterized protein n=1 Tax=Zopfia rhizophila CBS 207.26 TaxID=1314779 RepID=A0A6A6EE38_9PEZI|nr:hypothetical protein K469DRAFT_685099 [Zopfia rhizophila CBS 207.26]
MDSFMCGYAAPVCFLPNIEEEIGNNGFHDPVKGRDRHYSRAAGNPCEDDPRSGRTAQRARQLMGSEEHEPLLNANIEQAPRISAVEDRIDTGASPEDLHDQGDYVF